MKSGGIRKSERVTAQPTPEALARGIFRQIDKLGKKPAPVRTADHFVRSGGEFGKYTPTARTRADRFAERSPVSATLPGNTLRVLGAANYLLSSPDTKQAGPFLKMALVKKWSESELTRLFEILFEWRSEITSHRDFRNLLDRDQNLFANQLTREANNNIAYRSVDFDIIGMPDDEIWRRIDESPYRPLINDNAARAMLQMVEKFGIA